MQKNLLIAVLIGGLLFTGSIALLEKADDVVNGPTVVDGSRRGLLNRLAHAISGWVVDKTLKDVPPPEDPSMAIKSSVPPKPLHELLISDGEELKHGDWL